MSDSTVTTVRAGLRLIIGAAVLGACSTGGEQVAGIDGSGSPAPAAVVAQGPIQGFGSIIVNGVRYDIDAAQISANGASVTEAALRVGQIVTVSGRIETTNATGFADSVVFEADIQGPVELIEASAGRLRVLGQTVLIDTTTVVELDQGRAIEQLVIGETVQVSGFANPDGSIAATRIGSLAASDDLRVIGIVSNLEPGIAFTIGELTIDYRQTLVIEGFPNGAPANGDRVLVEADAIDAEGRLVALELELLDATLRGEPGQEVEIEGLITRFASISDFDVSNTRVTADADTRYEGGAPADLGLGIRIEVEGRFDADGKIVADEIEIESGEDEEEDESDA